MRSPTAAMLWDIWRRNRGPILVIGGLTLLTWPFGFSDTLNDMLGMLSFLFLLGVFNYTETSEGGWLGRFPHRLLTMPVSSLRLVAVPMLSGIVSIELLHVLWMERLSKDGPTSPLFVGVLLAALMVFYQTVLWTFARLGALRPVVLGVIAIGLFAIGLLPSFPPTPPPPWRSEMALAGLVAVLAVAALFLARWHVASLRSGGGGGRLLFEPLIGRVADALPRKRRRFASADAAQFWFEWQCTGMALPALVGGVVLLIAPFTWLVRNDPGDTLRLLLGTLATPVLLAIPVGMTFSRLELWSNDLSVPAFVAVRPLSTEDMVAIKVKVAAVSAALSWLVVLAFLGVWLSLWANLDSVSRLAIQLWAVHHHSVYVVCAIAGLVVIAGMFLTWRFLVSRLWIVLSGNRKLVGASAVPLALVVTAGAAFDATRLPGWLLDDPARLAPVVWLAAFAVIAKYWLAAYAWRRIAPRYVRQYLLAWLAGTACFVTLGVLLWGVVRMYVPLDIYRFQSVLILLALMAVPLGRLGLAPSSLARNRHR